VLIPYINEYELQKDSIDNLDDPYGEIGSFAKVSFIGGFADPKTEPLDANIKFLTLLILEASR